MLIGNVVNFIFSLIGIIIIAGIFIRTINNMLSKEKSIEAIIIDKNSYDKEIIRKSEPPFLKKEYTLTFLCKNKKMIFSVSELSYKNFRLNQKGILKYKGNRFIDFK